MLVPLLLAALITAPPPPLQPSPAIPRGRDPWVFRCIFEDRTRMVILAPAEELWVAFNPATCAIQKVWKGEMLLRGKVWDFSQDNSAARGEILAESPSLIWYLPDQPPSVTTSNRIDTDQPVPGRDAASRPHETKIIGARFDTQRQWVFDSDNASITSPTMDLSEWRNIFVAFDETSRRAPFHVELSPDDGQSWNAQSFDSTTHGTSETDWQWNFKQIEPHPKSARLRVVQRNASHNKTLRDLRLFGDRPAWSATINSESYELKPTWRGYTLDPVSQSCILRFTFRLPDSAEVRVHHEFEASILKSTGDITLADRFEIAGLPAATSLELQLPIPARLADYRPSGSCELRSISNKPTLIFRGNGPTTLVTVLKREAAR